MSRAPKYCSHMDCMELVPGGVRHCDKHKTRWDIGRSKQQNRRSYNGSRTVVRRRIFERDGYRCVYCGDEATEIDHVIATAHGGSDDDNNLVSACHSCNERKRNIEALESRLS